MLPFPLCIENSRISVTLSRVQMWFQGPMVGALECTLQVAGMTHLPFHSQRTVIAQCMHVRGSPAHSSCHTRLKHVDRAELTRPHLIAHIQELVDRGDHGFDRVSGSRLSPGLCLLEVCSLQRLQSGDESIRVLFPPTQPLHIFTEAEQVSGMGWHGMAAHCIFCYCG